MAFDGTALQWVARTGKILLLFAGLAAALDLLGPQRLAGWAEQAERRREASIARRRRLSAVRPLHKLAATMATRAAHRGLPPESTWLTADEYHTFARDAWRDLRASGPRSEAELRNPIFTFGYFEDEAYRFLRERLTDDDRVALDLVRAELASRARWSVPAFSALTALAIPGLIWVAGDAHRHGRSPFAPILLTAVVFGANAFLVSSAFLFPRFTATLLWVETTVWLRLVQLGTTLIGRDRKARPLRWAALVAFIVGSLLDLVGSW